ncbi:MAG: N-acetylmuramic acid 6-phosphate etherase [Chitinophagaceae bacterium]|nr:N-acetylmuramic acid 6-phosphate etherase [Chitinophagaceae bacterium]
MTSFIKITEQVSPYRHLEKMPVSELLTHINEEDKKIPYVVEKAIPQIEKLVEAITDKMWSGGRLFYIGAGTSGRLAIVDASECPPTFGVSPDRVIGIIAGGKKAMTEPVEFAEDSLTRGWEDLRKYNVNHKDVVIGIAASGTTPYVIAALKKCREQGIITGCITNNPGSPLAGQADYPVELPVGPEFVTGSTRMKSGTSQKLVLNMISTATMIQLGRVEDNKMVNMQLSNQKLVERGVKMLMEKIPGADSAKAQALLLKYGSVKRAIEACKEEN